MSRKRQPRLVAYFWAGRHVYSHRSEVDVLREGWSPGHGWRKHSKSGITIVTDGRALWVHVPLEEQ